MNNIIFEIEELNKEIVNSHNKHYENSKTGLIIPSESPNGNLIYHLYSDGGITFQKGGWAYLQRSEFTSNYPITGWEKMNLKFVKESEYNKTYVILTNEECLYFRSKMNELIAKL